VQTGGTLTRQRLWPHTLAVCLILAAIGVASGWTGSIINSDEAATLSQAEIVRTTGAWGIVNPAFEIDPEGRWFAIDRSEQAAGRFYPYTKHIVYPMIVRLLGDIGGLRMVLAMQGVAVGLAAGLAALMMKRLVSERPKADRLVVLTVWVVGLGSPLAFDSSWVMAHGYGALAGGLAGFGALVVTMTESPRRPVMLGPVVALATGISVGVLLRSEGVLWGLSLAVALGFTGVARRHRPTIMAAILAMVAALATYRFDTAIAQAAQGSAEAFVIEDSVPWLSGRLPGFFNSFLRTTYGDDQMSAVLPGVAAIGTAAAWFLAARLSAATAAAERRAAVIAASAATAAWVLYLLWQIVVGYDTMPGLLIASPVVLAAVASHRVERDVLRSPGRSTLGWVHRQPGVAMLCIAWVALIGATIATQYAAGGSMDWGGRYLHLGLPVGIVISILGLSRVIRSAPSPGLRPVLGLLAASVLLVSMSGVVLSVGQHRVAGQTVDKIAQRISLDPSAAEPGGAVVVTTNPALGRALWPQALTQRWLSILTTSDARDAAPGLDLNTASFVLVVSPDEVSQFVDSFAPEFRAVGPVSTTSSLAFVHMERIRR